MSKRAMYTKDQIKGVIKLWEGKTKEEIGEELGLKPFQVNYLAGEIRKAGYKLSRKRMTGRTRLLVKEVIASLI